MVIHRSHDKPAYYKQFSGPPYYVLRKSKATTNVDKHLLLNGNSVLRISLSVQNLMRRFFASFAIALLLRYT